MNNDPFGPLYILTQLPATRAELRHRAPAHYISPQEVESSIRDAVAARVAYWDGEVLRTR